jgi:hypothetical protein
MSLNPDFSDLFAALNAEGVRYLLVGGHAYSFHVEPRFTKDLDVWVEATAESASKVLRALLRFGAPADKIEEADFRTPRVTVQLGVAPNRIDILTTVSGLEFESAWSRRVETRFGEQPIWVIGRQDLETNKRASGRDQDLVDLKKLRVT